MDERRDLSRAPEGQIAADRATTFTAAVRRGDARAAAQVFAPDAWLMAPSIELIAGRPAIEAYWQAGLEAGVRHVDLDALEVEQRDGLIFEVGRYAFHLQSADDGPVVERGRYVVVHRQAPDGEWRWAVELFHPDVPAAVGPRASGRSPSHSEGVVP